MRGPAGAGTKKTRGLGRGDEWWRMHNNIYDEARHREHVPAEEGVAAAHEIKHTRWCALLNQWGRR